MINFNEWEHILTSYNSFIDIALYYMLEKNESEITVRIKENVDGWEEAIGTYPNLQESIKAIEEYKEKVEKLIAHEKELFD